MESTPDPLSLCRRVREAGMRAGVALKPGTPAEAVTEYVEAGAADMVLVMTVEPGFGGQKFMADMMGKVRYALGFRATKIFSFPLFSCGEADSSRHGKCCCCCCCRCFGDHFGS